MKKLFIITSALLLVLSCQKPDNLLGVDPDLPLGTGAANLPTVTSITPVPGGEIVDQNSSQAGIQGRIEVVFSDYMDKTTVTNLANISLLNTRTGEAIPNSAITTEYFPEIFKLYIYLSDVPDSGIYLLRLKAGGMTNTYGSPLDFDEDNLIDGIYDDYLAPFYTSPIMDTMVIPLQPSLTSFSPDTIATNNQQPTITLTFPALFDMDTLTLNTSNITLANESGTPQTLNILLRTPQGIILQPAANLATGTNYRITVKCDNIKRLGDHATPVEFLKLDGDDDGPEANEPDLVSCFRVDDPNAPPRLNSVVAITGGATFTFSRLLDATTIHTATIAVYDQNGFVPGELRIYTDAGNNYTIVDYFYLRPITAGRHAWASKTLKATNGYFFDGNNNGIGGEPWDDRNVAF